MQCNTAPYIIGHGKHRPCKNRAETVHPWLTKQKAMKSFDFTAFSGAMEGTRTPGLLIRSQSLYPAELPTHTFRSEHDIFYHSEAVLSTVFCNYLFIFLQSPSFSRCSVLSVSIFRLCCGSGVPDRQAALCRKGRPRRSCRLFFHFCGVLCDKCPHSTFL